MIPKADVSGYLDHCFVSVSNTSFAAQTIESALHGAVKVDRIATAWLIRKFIDPKAKFAFDNQRTYLHDGDAVLFDMFEGEFSHEGGLCTFEVLLRHAALTDPCLQAIAEAVHDIDLKDEKYQRPETNGLAAMIDGIVAMHQEDEKRVEEGAHMMDTFYAGFWPERRRQHDLETAVASYGLHITVEFAKSGTGVQFPCKSSVGRTSSIVAGVPYR